MQNTVRYLMLSAYVFLLFAAIFHVASIKQARADWTLRTIRTLCMPEQGAEHFSVHLEDFYDTGDFVYDLDDTPKYKKQRQKDLLDQYGIMMPEETSSYTCKLDADTYTIEVNHPIGGEYRCGADPIISLSLKKNKTLLLDNVAFSPDCHYDDFPYLADLSIDHDDGELINATLSDGMRHHVLNFNSFKTPVSQNDIECLTKHGLLDSSWENRGSAFAECKLGRVPLGRK